MCKVVRGHQNSFHHDHHDWYLRLKDEHDITATKELLKTYFQRMSGLELKDYRLGPFSDLDIAKEAAKIVNVRGSQLRTYGKREGKEPPPIEEFVKNYLLIGKARGS